MLSDNIGLEPEVEPQLKTFDSATLQFKNPDLDPSGFCFKKLIGSK